MKRDIKNEIITKNVKDFSDWFETIDDDLKEIMYKGFFGPDDPRDKAMKRIVRKQKIKRIGGGNEL